MWKTIGRASHPLKPNGQTDDRTLIRCQKNTLTGQFRTKVSRGKEAPKLRIETTYWNRGEKGEEWK